jgi:hypothetical protein
LGSFRKFSFCCALSRLNPETEVILFSLAGVLEVDALWVVARWDENAF